MRGKIALKVLFPVLAVLLLGACGEDDVAPADPSSSTIIPDAVFFNLTSGDEMILFSGRATDNRWVDSVQISFDNGGTWKDAQIDPTPSVRDVSWSYYATDSDMPSPSTVLIRVADQDANETTSSAVPVRKSSGAATGSVLAFFSDADPGEVLALSSGEDYAYGNAGTALTVPVDVNLTVLGAGYGDAETSGGIDPPANAVATVLQAPPGASAILDVSADLVLKNIRFVGSLNAISIDGADASVQVEDCLFDGQGGWAVRAVGGGDAISIRFLSNVVDASSSNDASGGGLYLEDADYEVSGSEFHLKNDEAEGAGVMAVGGAGSVEDCIFEGNYLAIWASGGSPVITNCNILGGSYGINLTGGSGSAEIRSNAIDGHSSWGLRVGGEMELVLRRNAITDNGRAGVLIDSQLSNVNLIRIDMGTFTDQGRNLFNDNTHPDGNWAFDTQVYVTQGTSEGPTRIPANYNYWGYFNATDINTSIVDNGDQGGGRATVAVGNFYITTSEVGP